MRIGLCVLCVLCGEMAFAAADEVVRLVVPYVKQPEALCGGAAAAMMFRYYGDAKADAREFEPLVDRRAGGIATDVLARAIEERAWRVVRFTGSVESVRDRLRERQPVIVLIEDRPHRFHYVVVVGITGDHIVLHDPARGPSRLVPLAEFAGAWEKAGYWALLVLPPAR